MRYYKKLNECPIIYQNISPRERLLMPLKDMKKEYIVVVYIV
jgi:hypothetical protein